MAAAAAAATSGRVDGRAEPAPAGRHQLTARPASEPATLPAPAAGAPSTQGAPSAPSSPGADPDELSAFGKRRRLSYLQSLLLRRWPCAPLAVCAMSSLLCSLALAALSAYLTLAWAPGCRGAEFRRPLEAAPEPAALAARALPPPAGQPFQRLSGALEPLNYDLFMEPQLAEPFTFRGEVNISMRCLAATDNVTLHANELDIQRDQLELRELGASGGSGAPRVLGLHYDRQLQYAVVRLERPLEAGRRYSLRAKFAGRLGDDLAGFYRIKYDQANSSEPTWIAATQFQATDARRAFPCFDEPLYKATFSISIRHWRNMSALSNMPVESSHHSPDGLWTTDTFARSRRMSTYLVAFAVTNFESRKRGNITVWTRPGLVHTAEYALDIAGRILRHYERFFGIEYPLPKMDMIALPDFNAGAMENWGLITYRETAMLYDPASSSAVNKQRVAVVVAHELAHQWFGNLVTPKWWDDLWLNEGFASFVEYLGVDEVEPGWRMLDQFVVEEVQNVFRLDALSSSHQISIPVQNPDEISDIFDTISYAKGASVIRMMRAFLTEPVFKRGLQSYLAALAFSNAEQSDLWAHLERARLEAAANGSVAAPAVERVMNSWTLQTGYPLVTLSRNYEPGAHQAATLDQSRYRGQLQRVAGNGSSLEQQPQQRWEVPITYTWRSEASWEPSQTRLWLHQDDSSPRELSADQLPAPADQWVLVNVHQIGYYRVNYDARNWRLLTEQLLRDHAAIASTNRAQLLDDLLELARNSVLDYRLALEATRYLQRERDYLPWDAALMHFGYIDDMLQRTPLYGAWKDYVAELIEPYYARYKHLDWTTSAHPTGPNRTNLAASGNNDVLEQNNMVNAISWACQVEGHCVAKAKAEFASWRKSGTNTIMPALRYTTYCTAIENGDKRDWDFLWQVYEREQAASERDRILRALGCTKEMWLLARYLEWTFSKTKPIRRQDGAFVFRTIARNNFGRDLAFNFMRERWATIKEHYGKTSFSLSSLMRSFSGAMNTQVELDDLMSFYETIKHDVGAGKRSLQIAIEEVESNVQWRARNYRALDEWLRPAARAAPAAQAA